MSDARAKMMKALGGVDTDLRGRIIFANRAEYEAALERVTKAGVREYKREERAKEKKAAQKAAANLRKQAAARRAASGAASQAADMRQRAVIADLERRFEKSTDPAEQAEIRLTLLRERLVQLYRRGAA
jgi:hypothetical protein